MWSSMLRISFSCRLRHTGNSAMSWSSSLFSLSLPASAGFLESASASKFSFPDTCTILIL
ncbi:unnamed protein product [Meloidogyne enterolobii]|uniref:Uncharacterized protein n=1 Tax=Meloidogyne enterolobii TaxID=390850 RepID=A0ACB0YZB1_MELEN